MAQSEAATPVKSFSMPTLVVSPWLREVLAHLDTAFGLFTLAVLVFAGKLWLDDQVSSAGIYCLLAFISFNLILSQFSLRYEKSSFLLEIFRNFVGNPILAPQVYLNLNGPLSGFWPVYLMSAYFCAAILMAMPRRPLLWASGGVVYQVLLLTLTTMFWVEDPDWDSVVVWIGVTLVTSIIFSIVIHTLQRALDREAKQSKELSDAIRKISDMQKTMLDVSRQAGMAEVASGVLHNVGNVLNSVNISTGIALNHAQAIKGGDIKQVVGLLEPHAARLGEVLGSPQKGEQLVAYLDKLGQAIQSEQSELIREVGQIHGHVEHLKHIIQMQQDAARLGTGFVEDFKVDDLIEDALKLSLPSFQRHGIRIVREPGESPVVRADRHKVFQILVNLIGNSRHALKASNSDDKVLTIRCSRREDDRIAITVSDNGCGIAPENAARIFSFGFTTKKEGHGFGLHASLLAAKAIDGALSCESAGVGQGATFTLELPLRAAEPKGKS